MSRKVVYTIFYICLLAIPTYGQQAEDVFDDKAYDLYAASFDLNESKNYLEAYRQILLAERAVDEGLSKKNIRAAQLSDTDFSHPYWTVKKSKAEIAYMLGIYTDMYAISQELRQALHDKPWKNGSESEAVVNAMQAELAKIDGSRCYLTEAYDSAEVYLSTALRLGRFPGNDVFLNRVYDDLAQLYYKQGLYEKALASLDSILASAPYQDDARSKETQQNIQTVRSQRALCLARLGRFAEALKDIEGVRQFFRNANPQRLYAEALRKKAKILMLQYDATGKYTPEATTLYQEYLTISRRFIDDSFVDMSESEREQYWMAEQPFVTDCFRLEAKAPGLLYDVALYSKAVLLQMGRDFKEGMTETQKKKALSAIRTNWKKVQERMPASSVAIEFVCYEKAGAVQIAAVVLAKDAASPAFVHIMPLSAFKQIELKENLSVGDALCSTAHEDKNLLYDCQQLPSTIWNEGLRKVIGKNRNVYFAADGIFHQLAIEYLLPEELKSKSFYRLTSTRLLTDSRRKVRTDNMLMCGGVDYAVQCDSPASAISNDEQAYSLMSGKGMGLAYLNGSKAEVDSVEELRHRKEDMVLRADSVTETAMRTLMNKYHLVLISTHGYFAEAATMGTDIRPVQTDIQLSQSCLFLAGAEGNMKNHAFDASQPDGILSARELAGMDLSDVDLVTLSACQSGLGYITVDGVSGLQRGLKTAGVRAVIASLWEVDDQATITLMKTLYANLERGQSLHDAFRHARTTLATTVVEKKYPRRGVADLVVRKTYRKPQYYDAFILIDGLE